MCEYLQISRSAYYRWLKNPVSKSEEYNEKLAVMIEEIHSQHPDKGYRRIRDDLYRNMNEPVNDKRILRICRVKGIRSTIKYRPASCTVSEHNPQYTAENILHRSFHAEAPNQKWLTDVSEFKYYQGPEIKKVYLSAILDLYDRRIVSWVISDHNDNPLVMDTFDLAVEAEPDAHPLFHSDRGYQYTSRSFHYRLEEHDMTQSMSRVGHCIDNGPMEGFWGIMKREMYYGCKYKSREALVEEMELYIHYYNDERLQRKLGVRTPNEYHEMYYNSLKTPSDGVHLMA